MNQVVRVAVTGAAGQIGYALLFRIASGAMFGENTRVILQLIELEHAIPALQGVVMELEDCAFPLLEEVHITHDPHVGFRDAQWILLVGSAPRKAGMERSDLLTINAPIFVKQGRAIQENAARDAQVLVVGNPCNSNALIVAEHAPDFKHRVYAMTSLDEHRAYAYLAQKLHKSVRDLDRLVVWGNHSATQYPDLSQLTVERQPIGSVDFLDDFVQHVQNRGASVIQARGASSAASAAHAALMAVRYAQGSKGSGVYSMVCRSSGAYDVPVGLMCSFPCKTLNQQVTIDTQWPVDEHWHRYMKPTIQELMHERQVLKEQGFLGASHS